MNEMEKMWVELAKHQPIADKQGYGDEWARMCNRKTEEAAKAAARVKLEWPLWGAAWAVVYAIQLNPASTERGERAAAYAINCMQEYNKQNEGTQP
jgi:hypothetical protein